MRVPPSPTAAATPAETAVALYLAEKAPAWAETTRCQVQGVLLDLLRFVEEEGVFLPENVEGYVLDVKARCNAKGEPRSIHGINSTLAVARGFLKWAYETARSSRTSARWS